MTKKKNLTAFMIAIIVMLFSLPANAQGKVGYVEWDEVNTTLTFKGGTSVPAGASALNTDSKPGWNKFASSCTNVVFDASFNDVRPTSCCRWFQSFSNLSTIEGIEYLNTAKVTTMEYMFNGCSGLTSLDLSSFNTAEVTDMFFMFNGCSGLKTIYVSDAFTTNKVIYDSGMFAGCVGLKGATSYNVGKTGKDMANFDGYFTPKIITPYVKWNGDTKVLTFKVANTKEAGSGVYVLNEGASAPGWLGDVSSDCEKVVFTPSFKQAKPTSCFQWFLGFSKLSTIEGIGYLNTDNVKTMQAMFNGCSGLTTLDVSKFNTAKVTYMNSMFQNCSGLTSLNLSNFNTANVTTMYEMFANCSKLTSLDLSSFNTDKVTDMDHMFFGCSDLTTLDLSSFNTAEVTEMDYMFNYCSKLTSLDLSSFNTAKVTDMYSMFDGCSGLTTIYVSDDFTTNEVSLSNNMFKDCTSLNGKVPYNSDEIDKKMANYTGYFKTYYKLGNEEKVELCGDPLQTENSLVLSDDKNFVAHAPFKASLVSYTRNITSTSKWYTLCLPFAYNTTPQNFTAYKLKSATDNSVEIEEMTGEIAAGTPIIFKFKDGANKNIDISVSNADIKNDPVMASTTENDCQLYGTYQEKTFSLQDGNTFIIYKDRLMNPAKMLENQNVKKVGVKPFRAYMTMTSHAGTGAKSFSIGSGDEGTTAIDLLNSVATDDAEYYDINGRRIDAPAKGVNIVRRGNKTMKLIIK